MVWIAPMLKPVAKMRLWSMQSSVLNRAIIALTYGMSLAFVQLVDSACAATKMALPPESGSMP